MKLKKGFTLIELLVVIAIIGILSSVVLASVNIARQKAKDVSVKAGLKGIISQSSIIYDSLFGYGIGIDATVNTIVDCTAAPADSIFGTTTISAMVAQIAANGDLTNVPRCITGGTSDPGQNSQTWAISAQLQGGAVWCADSTNVNNVSSSATTPDDALDTTNGICL